MNWTKTPPTKPGAYWNKNHATATPRLLDLYFVRGELIACGHQTHGLAESICGEWCLLVPAVELEKAFNEGARCFGHAEYHAGDYAKGFANSRARRVAEGDEV